MAASAEKDTCLFEDLGRFRAYSVSGRPVFGTRDNMAIGIGGVRGRG
jgi:hypothetical protein